MVLSSSSTLRLPKQAPLSGQRHQLKSDDSSERAIPSCTAGPTQKLLQPPNTRNRGLTTLSQPPPPTETLQGVMGVTEAGGSSCSLTTPSRTNTGCHKPEQISALAISTSPEQRRTLPTAAPSAVRMTTPTSRRTGQTPRGRTISKTRWAPPTSMPVPTLLTPRRRMPITQPTMELKELPTGTCP